MQMTTLGALTKVIREEGKVMWQDFYSLSAPFHLEEMNDKQSKGLGCRERGGRMWVILIICSSLNILHNFQAQSKLPIQKQTQDVVTKVELYPFWC